LTDTLICPHCQEKLWVAQMQIPLLTCPRCLGLIINPNAAARASIPPPLPQQRIEPRMVIPIEEEVGYDLHGTVGGMLVLALVLIIGGVGAIVISHQPLLSVVLVGAGLMTAGGVMFANRRARAQSDSLPPPMRSGGVLEYQQSRTPVSVLAFIGGFIIAIVIGAICFYALVATGDRTKVETRRLVFAGMVIVITGLIIAAINLRRVPGWTGFGRGVAIGLALAMMALGPCAACYVLTLFG